MQKSQLIQHMRDVKEVRQKVKDSETELQEVQKRVETAETELNLLLQSEQQLLKGFEVFFFFFFMMINIRKSENHDGGCIC